MTLVIAYAMLQIVITLNCLTRSAKAAGNNILPYAASGILAFNLLVNIYVIVKTVQMI